MRLWQGRRCTFCGSDTPSETFLLAILWTPSGRGDVADAPSAGTDAPFRSDMLVPADNFVEPRLVPRCIVSRYATAWAESLEGAISGHQSWALLCRYRCRLLLAEVPRGTGRNSELKLRLRMWETGQVSDLISKILGQQHSGPLCRRIREMLPQTDEQRGKRACALTARGSISKAVTGLVGGASQGSADCRKNLTSALIPRSSCIGTHSTIAKSAEAARIAWSGGRWKAARSAVREQGRSKTGIASLPHVKLAPMSAPGQQENGRNI